MNDTLWYHLIANCLSSTRFVDEYKRIYTVILLISKAIRRTHQGKVRRQGRILKRTAVLYALISAALFGVSTPAAKLLIGSIHPVTLIAELVSALRYCVASRRLS